MWPLIGSLRGPQSTASDKSNRKINSIECSVISITEYPYVHMWVHFQTTAYQIGKPVMYFQLHDNHWYSYSLQLSLQLFRLLKPVHWLD